jgi:hypothetical protein
MMALEIIRTVKRVANPSAVRKTRKARMTDLTAAVRRPYPMADGAAAEKSDRSPTLARAI